MKLTKVKIAIVAAILIPSSAFAYRASQPVEQFSEPEPVKSKAVKQEKKEVKVEEPIETEVVDEPAVITTEIKEDAPVDAPVEKEVVKLKTIREIAMSLPMEEEYKRSPIYQAYITCTEEIYKVIPLPEDPEERKMRVTMYMINGNVRNVAHEFGVNCNQIIAEAVQS